MHYPFMSQAEIEAQERDNARFHPDPDAGRHHPECLCGICYPDDEPEPPSSDEEAAPTEPDTDPYADAEPPF